MVIQAILIVNQDIIRSWNQPVLNKVDMNPCIINTVWFKKNVFILFLPFIHTSWLMAVLKRRYYWPDPRNKF